MSENIHVDIDLGGKKIRLATGLLARQAAGSCTVTLEETVLFSAVTAASKPREGMDFFPLQVEYREKFYAAGRLPGGFFKREARPSEKEVLTARMTDRPIRALFSDDYRNEVQINNLVLCADGENDSDMLSINAASAALTLSEIPFFGPVGAVRVGRVAGEWIVNPGHSQMAESDVDLVYVGTTEKMMMIEGTAKEVAEADLVAAMKLAQDAVKQLCEAQLELRRKAGLPEKKIEEKPAVDPALLERVRDGSGAALAEALNVADKQERRARMSEARAALVARLTGEDADLSEGAIRTAFDVLEGEIIRRNVLDAGRRMDGRGPDDLRALDGQVSLLPRTHGSAIFSRGDTQALAVVTLGTHQDAQRMDAVTGGPEEKQFLLHYNFPPYSVGEVGRLGSTSRREIGHGALAERSIRQVMPEEYPYTVRVVSEIMGSNGSSSMASVCAGTMALMDAGVPLVRPVAGISIGLFSDGDRGVLVTDILGSEDHHGDMDFKVAGTREGVTGFQVDLKIRGLNWDFVEGAFEKARVARGKIIDFIESLLPAPRAELSPYAPRVKVLQIPTDKIGALIGPGGKNIRRITDTYKVQIDIEDDGSVHIFSTSGDAMEAAVREVESLTAEAEVGKLYQGRVTGVKDFGCFVEILPGLEGLVHISELANFRVNSVSDVCKIGDMMWVKCLNVDDSGKIRLSRRAALAERDEEEQAPPDQGERQDRDDRDHRGDRGGDRGGRGPRR